MYEKSHILTQHLKNIHPLKQFSHWRNSKAIHGNNATVITDKTLTFILSKTCAFTSNFSNMAVEEEM